MSKSYDKVNQTLRNQPPKNQPPMQQRPVDPIAEVTQHRDQVTIDTEMELKAVLGNKIDPVDTPEELAENRFKP